MALSEYNISKLSDSFIATFLSACLDSKKIAFLDICLAFVYASEKMMTCLVELGILTKEQVGAIKESLSEAAEQSMASKPTQELIKILKSFSEVEDVGSGKE